MCFVMYDLTTGLSYVHSIVYCDNRLNSPWQYMCLDLLSGLSIMRLYEKTDRPVL